MKPFIGISMSAQTDVQDHGTFHRYIMSETYVRAVEAGGGIALPLPPQLDAISDLANVLDGLLLSGGTDIAPTRYGDADVHEATYGIDPERDEFELALFDAMLQLDKPVFGICRGIQVMNVALGGTLIQDVPSQHPGAADIGHRQHHRGVAASEPGHRVSTTATELLPIFDDDGLNVNSFHHQAIREIAPALTATAYSPDGLVEAVAMTSRPDVFAVQWHPEMMFEAHPEHLRPFIRLTQAAAARKLASSLR